VGSQNTFGDTGIGEAALQQRFQPRQCGAMLWGEHSSRPRALLTAREEEQQAGQPPLLRTPEYKGNIERRSIG